MFWFSFLEIGKEIIVFHTNFELNFSDIRQFHSYTQFIAKSMFESSIEGGTSRHRRETFRFGKCLIFLLFPYKLLFFIVANPKLCNEAIAYDFSLNFILAQTTR